MIIGAWNVRGINGHLTQNKVANLAWNHKISIFCLIETKLRFDRIEPFINRKFSGWKWCSNLDTVEGGRILVIWNPIMVDCSPLSITPQVIHCRIVDKITSKTFVCSFVYAYNLVTTRRELWSSLMSWGINILEPWMLLGDFNSTISLEDRLGGTDIANTDMQDFVSCATMLGVDDAFFVGNQYTWTNNHHWAKLDRVLINSYWPSL